MRIAFIARAIYAASCAALLFYGIRFPACFRWPLGRRAGLMMPIFTVSATRSLALLAVDAASSWVAWTIRARAMASPTIAYHLPAAYTTMTSVATRWLLSTVGSFLAAALVPPSVKPWEELLGKYYLVLYAAGHGGRSMC